VTSRSVLLGAFFRALGHAVHERDGVCWVEVGRLSLMAVPATEAVAVAPGAVDTVLRDTGRVAATFVVADGTGVPAVAWWVRDPQYGLAAVQRQFRQNLRRGRDTVTVRRLEWREFRGLAFEVHCRAAVARGGPAPPTTTPAGWNRLCDLLAGDAGFEATGCLVDGSLAGVIVSLTTAGLCAGMMADCDPRFATVRPAHWLYHRFAAEMIRRPGIHGVTVGRQGIPPRPTLDAFKRHAGYVPEPIRLAAVLHPQWRPVLEPAATRGLLRWTAGLLGSRAGALANVSLLDAAVATRRSARGPDRSAGRVRPETRR